MLFYYITDRSQFHGDENARRAALLSKIAEAAHAGVDYIQIREKDISTRSLESLAQEAIRIVRDANRVGRRRPRGSRILINSRSDVALAVSAAGVHLRSDDLSPRGVRDLILRRGATSANFLIARSCHSLEDIRFARSEGADFVVFGPVFEKKENSSIHPTGLEALSAACRIGITTLALGGVGVDSARACIKAGAAGIAAIRLFQENPIHNVVAALCSP